MSQFLLSQLLTDAARSEPGAVAVVDGRRSLSYGELDRRANQVAHQLLRLGVAPGDRVGIYLDKSLEAVAAIHGILKAGAAYVPLDPAAPPSRLAYIIGNCDIRILVSSSAKASQWPALLAAGAEVDAIVVLAGTTDVVDTGGTRLVDAAEVASQDEHDPAVGGTGADLAYILYTSGSTGQPKGVMLSHLNALAFIDWAVDRFGIRPDDRLSSHAPLHFDLSIFDLFAAAKAGAAVVLVPPQASMFPVQIPRLIAQEGITIWYSVPSILTMVTLRGGLTEGDCPGLRAVLFAGEVFPTGHLRHLMHRLPHARFHNLYGPTETNVCTHYEVPELPEDQTDDIPIGRAIPNVEVTVVNDEGAPCSRGEVGELYVRGATVMQGYWADENRTRRALVADPPGRSARDPAYRTGDLVVEGDDGELRFLGRRDAQIKSRGYRIELGEIETALYAVPGVVECAVVALADDMVTNRIKAFVSVKGDVDAAQLAIRCGERLPRYMIPEMFEFCDALPKTSTGKIDRKALIERGGRNEWQ